ncbi:hypothetical protein GGS23DRAFT_544590 [Durotheca rogersii]|uniref:uncharacterized protein n=1 Tax=Durotheca rogersii TaxID=419775 RepID=UPI002220C72D|nr:uncharacterized protein GGS23DRAFT_544590 [Durotheca rogersii]KAI5868227.1 hypothetical protein GGS23DRAFT_544590 [Durotheca rogersii]
MIPRGLISTCHFGVFSPGIRALYAWTVNNPPTRARTTQFDSRTYISDILTYVSLSHSPLSSLESVSLLRNIGPGVFYLHSVVSSLLLTDLQLLMSPTSPSKSRQASPTTRSPGPPSSPATRPSVTKPSKWARAERHRARKRAAATQTTLRLARADPQIRILGNTPSSF